MPDHEHNFCQRQCIDEREAMEHKIDVMLSQDHRLMQYEETKDGPKIKREDETLFGFAKGSLPDGSFCYVQGKTPYDRLIVPRLLWKQ